LKDRNPRRIETICGKVLLLGVVLTLNGRLRSRYCSEVTGFGKSDKSVDTAQGIKKDKSETFAQNTLPEEIQNG
jgi:hypothetical protein